MKSFRTSKRNSQVGKDIGLSSASCNHYAVAHEMAKLFDCPESHFLPWPGEDAAELLKRAESHGCRDCYWQQDAICLQSEEEENFPPVCPGFREISEKERLMFS
jgi:hypothetical protein